MKICSLYGAGYYYMPGTDICLKLGGFVRYQLNVHSGNSISGGPQHGLGGRNTRIDEQEILQRVRALLSIDTRQQTAYGTLRSYMILGYTHDTNGGATLYANRGFIQIAGFTFGKATSFFDIFPNASFAYNAGNNWSGDSGDGGVILMSYTAQFGNGFSGTIAIEQQRRHATAYLVGATGLFLSPFAPGAVPLSNNHGGPTGTYPDIVANLRLDQSWGTWIVAGALHNISGGYYGPTLATATEAFGHPDDEWGWAATTGFIWNLPFITPGDRFSVQAVYSEGATGYHMQTRGAGGNPLFFSGQNVAFGFITDAVFSGNPLVNTFEKTTVWSVAGAFEHLWTPALKTSVYGSYIDVSHNATATATICLGQAVNPSFSITLCDPDWTAWTVGSRTEWQPVRGLTFGVDVIYQQINTARANTLTNLVVLGQNGGKPAGTYFTDDLDAWSAAFRVQRNFLP